MNKPVQKYPPGSDWLYIRIYGGPMALEEWLIEPFRSLLSVWKKAGTVKQFHFIHYLDPEYHLRLRFRLNDPADSGKLLTQIQDSCLIMMDDDLVWKIEVGTYEPEYERYGFEMMPVVEQWFELDSLFWLGEIGRVSQIEDPDIWKSALRSVHVLLDDFGAGIEDKINVIKMLQDSSVALFGLSRTMKGQLDAKYRKMKGEVILVLETAPSGYGKSLMQRTSGSGELIKQLHAFYGNPAGLFKSDLLPNLIHMSLNRAFRTRHRLQELVVYDFMGRYYQSLRARSRNVTGDAFGEGGKAPGGFTA